MSVQGSGLVFSRGRARPTIIGQYVFYIERLCINLCSLKLLFPVIGPHMCIA
jgi:hypothetical protein